MMMKLKRFKQDEHARLGELVRKDRENELSAEEAAELIALLKKATRVSEANARTIEEAREGAPTLRERRSAALS